MEHKVLREVGKDMSGVPDEWIEKKEEIVNREAALHSRNAQLQRANEQLVKKVA
jgi:hypothetical protein